jgi:hypothetical protein
MPLYTLTTWDAELEDYTPQEGLDVPSVNVTIHQLRRAIRELRRRGYSANYARSANSGRYGDPSVLIERTDGE